MYKWKCKDLGSAKELLHMRIHKNGSEILIDQCTYLEKVLERFSMTNARSATTPLPQGYYPSSYNGQVDSDLQSCFQQVIRFLLYIMLGTWPDITYIVTPLSWHEAKPSQQHLDKALYICWYLLGTCFYSLVFNGAFQAGLIVFTDSDWASDPNIHCSQIGWFIKLANCIFSWKSQQQQQQQITYSSTKAEYVALSDCSKQVVWLWFLLEELGYQLNPIPICGDNQGSIFMASNPVTEKSNKHIEIKWHGVWEFVHEKLVELYFIEGSNNPADMFTQNLGHVKLGQLWSQLDLVFYDSPITT